MIAFCLTNKKDQHLFPHSEISHIYMFLFRGVFTIVESIVQDLENG